MSGFSESSIKILKQMSKKIQIDESFIHHSDLSETEKQILEQSGEILYSDGEHVFKLGTKQEEK